MAQGQTRMTRQRAIILEELCKSYTHPTVDEIYAAVKKKLPRISLGTVYRNLDLLTTSGEINKIETAGNARRFDGNVSLHQHVCCIYCGSVSDILSSPKLPEVATVVAKDFVITGAKVEFEGICSACAKQSNFSSSVSH